MSYFIFDLDNEAKLDFDNFIIDDKINISDDSSKYLIFFDKSNAKEIYVKIPRIRLTYDWTNLKYNNIKIRLTPKYSKLDNFIQFIRDLEEFIINSKSIKKKNLEFVSILEKDRNIHYLKTFLQENKILITSNSNKKINITDFKNNGQIQIILKISSVWIKNNRYGLSTQIHQIKYFPPPDELLLDMIDYNNDEKKINHKKENEGEIIKIINTQKPILALDPKMLQSVKLKPVEPKN